jgi:7-alpha-hydroxysteroid dehydrogenase
VTPLAGRAALVTGASRGIGEATALALADAGADVALVARTADDLRVVAAEIRRRGRRASLVVADLRHHEAAQDVVDAAVRELGGLDIVVNNAGGAPPGPVLDVRAADLDEAFHFNVSATFEMVRASVPHLLRSEHASVVNVSSNLGHLVARGYVVYATVKAAVSHLTRLLAVELAPRVRVNAVAPSVVDTEGVAGVLRGSMRQRLLDATPLRRLARPEEVASTIVWLASQAAS